jgi:RNA polymerase sigma-70 factor (ECF subfamily)
MNDSPGGNRIRSAFETVLEGLRPEVMRFAMWLARDRGVAEDVVQETMIRAWRAQAELKDARAARAWLFTIARREHARLYERKRLPTVDLADYVLDEAHELSRADAGLDDADLLDLQQVIERLPDEYREPLVMQVLGGFTTQEIASELNLSQQAVLTRLFRARNRLRDLYGLTRAPDVDGDG